jgi:uncharacterized protein YndB with AHSA1/START domain
MKKIHMTTTIQAPREAVWKTMLSPDTYRIWTAAFSEGSYYEGSWEEGEKIRFLGPGGDGMVSEIAENRPHEFISIRHLGIIKDGVEDYESEEVRKWASALENYTFEDEGSGTKLTIDMDITPEHEQSMSEMWTKALAKLKEISEKGRG